MRLVPDIVRTGIAFYRRHGFWALAKAGSNYFLWDWRALPIIEVAYGRYLAHRLIMKKKPLKLHLGCGSVHLDSYVNIDCRKTRATDLVRDIRKLPFRDNSAELIETYHAIEHLPRHDLPKALKDRHRILMPGGRLVIECPDFDKNVRDYLEGVNADMNLLYIYGRQRFAGDTHYFGYNFARLKDVLEECGFINAEREDAQDPHTREAACLRVECVAKKGN